MVEEQLEESMPPAMVDAAAVGSAPHPSDPCFAPSQPEVNALGPAPAQVGAGYSRGRDEHQPGCAACDCNSTRLPTLPPSISLLLQTATRLLNEINRKGLNLDAQPLLTGLKCAPGWRNI